MSWLYLRAPAGDCSPADGCSTGEPSAPSKSTPTGKRSCSRAKRTACSILSQSGRTFEILTDARGVESWMSLLRASRASHSASPDDGAAPTTNATGGPIPSGYYAKYDRDSRCWRTCQGSLLTSTSEPFSGTWPKRGSMRNGACWARTTWARRTGASDCGYWPTPDAQVMNLTADPERHRARQARLKAKWGNGNGAGTPLAMAVKMFPTPSGLSANQGQGDGEFGKAIRNWPTPRSEHDSGGHCGRPDTLHSAVKLWPTPNIARRGCESAASKARRPNSGGVDLQTAVRYPLNEQALSGGSATQQTKVPPLNPEWVELLMGWPRNWTCVDPISPLECERWLIGFQSSDALHPLPQVSPRYGEAAWRGDTWEIGVARVAAGVKHRLDRLSAIGDGQVPAVVAAAWRMLEERTR